jgi:hypothetical protein
MSGGLLALLIGVLCLFILISIIAGALNYLLGD